MDLTIKKGVLPIEVMHTILCGDDGFDHQILDGLNNGFIIDAFLAKVLPKGTQRPFVALSSFRIFIGTITRAVFVNGVIG